MRLLYITEIFPDPSTGLGFWGGGERQFYELARRAVRRGHTVTVLTCRFPGQKPRETLEGIEVRRFGQTRDRRTGVALKSPVHVLGYILRTAREAMRIDCDVIHANAYYPIFAGRIAAVAKKLPLVSTLHDVPSRGVWTSYSKSALWGCAGYAATVTALSVADDPLIVVSEPVKRKVMAFKRRAEVIPNGVDLELLDSSRSTRLEGQILYVGRLVGYKRADSLVRAFSGVLSKSPRARLVVVGTGPELPRLMDIARELRIPRGSIEFKGTIPSHAEVARLFRESAIFVLPSLVEGEGIALKEAMAASLPVIAIRASGSVAQMLVKEGWNGLLVDPEDEGELTSAMVKLLENPDLGERMGRNGRAGAEVWTWDDAADRTLGLYGRILGRETLP